LTAIQKNLKTLEDCLPFIEFAYNRTIHTTTSHSPFEIVYGFNPPTHLELMHLSIDEMSSLDGHKKAELVKSIHERVRRRMKSLFPKPIKGEGVSSLNQEIEFGFTCVKNNSQPIK
jgi:hypothetical protein